MLFHVLLLFCILFMIFAYGASKLYVNIKDFEYSYLFWILYVVTILTTIEIIFCIIMWFKYYNKKGDIGPRGFQGYPGPIGDKGKCEVSCNVNLIVLLLIDMIEKNEKTDLSETNKQNIYDYCNDIRDTINTMSNNQVDILFNNLKYKYDNYKSALTIIKDNDTSDDKKTNFKTLLN